MSEQVKPDALSRFGRICSEPISDEEIERRLFGVKKVMSLCAKGGPDWLDAKAHRDELLALQAARAKVERLTEKCTAEHERESFLFRRGIDPAADVICNQCGGVGRHCYENTSTWMHGIGGQSITEDVCDLCWGSGATNRPGLNIKVVTTDLSRFRQQRDNLATIIAEAQNLAPDLIDGLCNKHGVDLNQL